MASANDGGSSCSVEDGLPCCLKSYVYRCDVEEAGYIGGRVGCMRWQSEWKTSYYQLVQLTVYRTCSNIDYRFISDFGIKTTRSYILRSDKE